MAQDENIINTVPLCFEEQARLRPDTIALVSGKHQLTYRSLNEQANGLALELKKLDILAGKQIALCMGRSLEQLTTILGILKAGAAYVPLDPFQPPERLHTILEEGNISSIIVTQKEAALFSSFKGKVIVLPSELRSVVENPNLSIAPQDLAYVMYTSGTTGIPKGVMIEHKNVVNYAQWFADYSKAYPEQRIDWSSDYIFDMTVSTTLVPLMLGMTIVLCSDEAKKDPALFLSHLQKNQISIIKITPSYFKELIRIVSKCKMPLPKLQVLVLGGERLLTADCLAWLDLYPKHILFNEYGPTEATVAVTCQKISKANIQSFGTNVPIGMVGSHMTCHILNAHNGSVAPGVAGELHIGGLGLARGYVNQPELTKEKFIGSPVLYKTGDLCRFLTNGAIEYLGRIDQQIKIRGFRVEPGEIEEHLRKHPSVADAVVLLHDDGKHAARLVAYCILKSHQANPSYTQMRTYLQLHLPEYMIPNTFVPIQSIPMTGNGKLDHRALPAPPLSGSLHYTPPETELEKTLAMIWSKELELPLIGREDNFFELGGNSLNAARIVSDIEHSLQKKLSLKDFYQVETIAHLAALIQRLLAYNTQDEYALLPSNKSIDPADNPVAKPWERDVGARLPLSDFQLFLWILKTFEPKARKLNLVSRKRWAGPIDVPALSKAFQALLSRQSILNYRIPKWLPTQFLGGHHDFKLEIHSMTDVPENCLEEKLLASVNHLVNFTAWSKENTQIKAELFYLPNHVMELQICLPHIISDEVSMIILWKDLTQFYLEQLENNSGPNVQSIRPAPSFDAYVQKEKQIIENHFEQDCVFWDNYLENTQLFSFPPKAIVHNMRAQKIAYSTYQKICPDMISELEHYSAVHKIGLYAVLCAAVSLTLRNISKQPVDAKPFSILINLVKSTRVEGRFDETIGCFLRLDPLKVSLMEKDNLLSVAKQIQESFIRDSNPMHASTIIKLASMSSQGAKKKWVIFIKLMNSIYGKFLKFFNIRFKSLQLLPALALFDRTAGHVICINLRNNFSESNNNKKEFCLGKTPIDIHIQQTDLENFDNVCDISFFRDDIQKNPYLGISSNLYPDFREQMANQIIAILEGKSGWIR